MGGGRPRTVERSFPAWASRAHAAPIAPSSRIVRGLNQLYATHHPSPDTIAASTVRSSTLSSVAPRGLVRSWSLADSPSTPSSTEWRWTRMPPIRGRSAAKRQAARTPITNATNDRRFGEGRRGASAIDRRVEMGRLR